MDLAAVVLAAGKGTRMKSERPKVLHKVCGKPMATHVIDAVEEAGAQIMVVVVGYKGEEVKKELGNRVVAVMQKEQLGTAHALMQARPVLEGFKGRILVVCGDTPLIKCSTLQTLVNESVRTGSAATVLTSVMEEPAGYGRVIRDFSGNVSKIVEQKDAAPEELEVKEVNTGIYCFAIDGLFDTLAGLKADNAQGEYYLTDIIDFYRKKGLKVTAVSDARPWEILGVNDRKQLAAVEKIMRQEVLDDIMLSGVTVVDPDNTYIESKVEIGKDTIIYPFTMIEGKTVIGENCSIGPSTRLVDVELGQCVKVEQSTVYSSIVGDNSSIGPFAYIRPECVLGKGVKVGDFVEMKKVSVGDGSKIPHLTYLGDSEVGKDVNVGAGTITCNYDGKNKHPTHIGDGAFIGSNANLVAPVRVGEKAVIGAGSTITKDVPPAALGVARSKQKVYDKWKSGNGNKD
ncbi:MAG: bifunctional UDP-N-acetylglucosamine diphosphorylase/glucosamine-1-phosphate N-acetyltransferase GlmU [Firmicutes bacterium]|nr:bifunctional UDP-N-acetylglucosamine diphosphorylase/glucosamine-1-phosphate N-acetyltransferase GlmU [Bacillota bacterium]